MEHRPLAYLEPVDPATVWKNEPTDFVPWLAKQENLRRLGDALGIDLEPVTREAAVGRFRADLVCSDRDTGGLVAVEAQLGPSDHGHLGQLLTYAEGLGADVVVWLGTWFHGEHRSVLGRLNRSSDFRCFAVAIDLWTIAGSPTAPQFTVLAAPRDWTGPATGTPGHRTAAVEASAAPSGAAGRPRLRSNPIKTLRMNRGMTQKQLAKAAGISPACVGHIETDRTRGLPKTRAAIEKALELAPGALDRTEEHGTMEPDTGAGQETAE